MEVRDTQEREGQRRMKKERNIKTVNTFTILQEEDIGQFVEEEESTQIVKTDKDEKKIYGRKGKGRIRKVHKERKRASETRPKPGLPINNSYKVTQNKNSVPLKCKSAKCHNERYNYKTKE